MICEIYDHNPIFFVFLFIFLVGGFEFYLSMQTTLKEKVKKKLKIIPFFFIIKKDNMWESISLIINYHEKNIYLNTA